MEERIAGGDVVIGSHPVLQVVEQIVKLSGPAVLPKVSVADEAEVVAAIIGAREQLGLVDGEGLRRGHLAGVKVASIRREGPVDVLGRRGILIELTEVLVAVDERLAALDEADDHGDDEEHLLHVEVDVQAEVAAIRAPPDGVDVLELELVQVELVLHVD